MTGHAGHADRLGQVVSVAASRLTGLLDSSPRAGESAVPRLGDLVRIEALRGAVYGLISSLAACDPCRQGAASGAALMEIDLLGEAVAGQSGAVFRRGVSSYPLLGAAVFASGQADLALVYAKPDADCVRVGSLHQDPSVTAHLIVDTLLGEHFAVLGSTGSGKSCAVAVILRAVLRDHPHGRIVVLDLHDEYAGSFGDGALRLAAGDLQLSYWFLNFEETVEALCGVEETSRQIEAAILREAVVAAKRDHQAGRGADVPLTVDTPTPYRLTRLIELLREGMGRLDKPENATPYLRLIGRIESLRRDARFGFMFSGLVTEDILEEVLATILRIPAAGKPVTIVNLAGVPSEILDVVVSLLCRLIFDFALWSGRGQGAPALPVLPVLLVCEEAHRYIPRDLAPGRREGAASFGPTRKAITRIAKEGRKYGVSLGLVTQRPSEISETVLSQCNTLFSLRLSNESDQEFVRRALPDTAAGLLGALPALRTQEAVVVGEGVSVPMRIRFDDLGEGERPLSRGAPFSASWRDPVEPGRLVAEAVERWRGRGK
ncbi:MAG: ATP-binding protein [Desulfovibrionaceae bacterium]|nr:ATP-binding protein [Desulfovibrionaceae bacterium]MBF0514753.1 ATP-binding protein [Desulfovibrionaceae bacterium]